MFEKITPEQAGISSEKLLKTFKTLENNGYNFHSFMLLKDSKVFAEAYWAPFNANKPHRMYSVTKSFVAVAIGILYTKGLIDLDEPFINYFPEYSHLNIEENFKKQTIRHMLTMTTAARPGYWFSDKPEDRLEHYISSRSPRIPGAWFEYDSEGSFALGCLVEKISGMKLLDFMNESFLKEIGFSDNTKMLYCPGGHTWGDSSMICTTRELALFAQFVSNGGNWNGNQIVDKKYMSDAISSLSSPTLSDDITRQYAYGYQIWKPSEDTFAFFGMGGQFAIVLPSENLIFVCTADNQSQHSDAYAEELFNAVLELFRSCGEPLNENAESHAEFEEFCKTRILRTAIGNYNNPISEKISRKTFLCNKNSMGWKSFSIDFENKILSYENAQGKKQLSFEFGKNIFQKFPQTGYSDLVGTKSGKDGNMYECAVSAAWHPGNHFGIFVQVIDDYFGRLSLNFCFPNEKSCGVYMYKNAEDFLHEYNGHLVAYCE